MLYWPDMSREVAEFMHIYTDRMSRALAAGETPIIEFNRTGSATVVLSFTSKYRPFIPTSRSYNRPDQRLYIRECRFTRELGLELQRSRIELQSVPGGRIFINEDCAYIKLEDGQQVEVTSMGLGPYARSNTDNSSHVLG